MFFLFLCFVPLCLFWDSFLEPKKKTNKKPPQENPPTNQDGLIEGEELREFCSLKSPDLKELMVG